MCPLRDVATSHQRHSAPSLRSVTLGQGHGAATWCVPLRHGPRGCDIPRGMPLSERCLLQPGLERQRDAGAKCLLL